MSNLCNIAILAEKASEQLQKLSLDLHLPLLFSPVDTMDLYLVVTPNGLGLQDAAFQFKPLVIDFKSAALEYRKKFGGGKNEPLAKAVGVKADKKPVVLDATAGLGRDAFILASLGCQVTMLERNPVMHAFLDDALTRYKEVESQISLTLVQANAMQYLSQLGSDDLPEVIYLDPMYPHRFKSALVKKEMRLLRCLVGDDEDANALFNAARQYARSRIVVKRPEYAAPLDNCKPSSSIRSGNHRFDIVISNAR